VKNFADVERRSALGIDAALKSIHR
jgi:hypothetical protein